MPAPLPETMTAIKITEPGGPEVLQPREVPVPAPGDGEILVKVAAAGINRPDVFQRRGFYPPPPGAPDTPGLEIAGEVVATGPGTQRFSVGDTVCALVAGGGYAEYCVAAEANALPVPDGFTMVQAASLPETFFTVWTNVFDRGRLAEGETILVHGGSSGIGTTAIMLAKAFGARVLVTAGSDEKCAFCETLGADRAINYRDEDYVEVVKEVTGGKGADVILDMVGGDYIERDVAAAAESGRIVLIAFLKGSRAELDFNRVMRSRLTITGSTLRPRTVAEKANIAKALEEKVWPLLAAGRIAPVIDSEFPLAEAASGHARIEEKDHIGKIVLTV